MNLFFEIHQDILREGPGDNKSTRQANVDKRQAVYATINRNL